MRKPKWTTRRWRMPSSMRTQRMREFFARKELTPLLGNDFIEALEKHRRDSEQLQWRLLTIQAPIFMLLAFSLLHVNVHVGFLGISAGATKALREVLLLTSSTFGIKSMQVNRQLAAINEILKAYVQSIPPAWATLRESSGG
jgi:hypothetical protein